MIHEKLAVAALGQLETRFKCRTRCLLLGERFGARIAPLIRTGDVTAFSDGPTSLCRDPFTLLLSPPSLGRSLLLPNTTPPDTHSIS